MKIHNANPLQISVSMLTLALLLTGCGQIVDSSESSDSLAKSLTTSENNSTDEVSATDISAYFSERDLDTSYREEDVAHIFLNGDSASCDSNAVKIEGTKITITDEGTYILSGTLDDGMIVVNSDKTDQTQLVLKNASIHSESSAAIYIMQSDKVFITTSADSTNTLSNGGSFVAIDENDIDSVIFSKEDLTLNGDGSLIVTSPAGHGILSKDSLTITGGTYDINSASRGLSGKDDICIADGNFTIVSGKDGIHAENTDDTSLGYIVIQNGTFDITAEGDGISSSSFLQIQNGDFTILAGGGSENATAHSSSTWGDFRGGGKHDYNMKPGNNRQPDNHQPGNHQPPDMNQPPVLPNSPEMEQFVETETESTSMKGIKSTAGLLIQNGNYEINSADDSVHSNTSVTIDNGSFEIASGDDAFHADDTLTINNGSFLVTESYEGLEGLHVVVTGGEITLTASDDGINAAGGTDASGSGGRDNMFGPGFSSSNGSITISGGTLNITASGDGIDANGTLDITGGYTIVCGPTQGDTATLDYDSRATISGGTFIGTGASGMAQTFSENKQGLIAIRSGNQAVGTTLTLTDKSGNIILTHTPELSYGVIILSSPEMISGETYTLTVGELSEEFAAY